MSNLRNLFQNVEKAKIDYYWQLIREVVTGPERERVAFLDKVKKTEPECDEDDMDESIILNHFYQLEEQVEE